MGLDRDISELRLFYHTRLGRIVTRRLNALLRPLWPALTGQVILGIGYAVPFLQAWPDAKTIAVMTASQGVTRWPVQGPCATVLTEDHLLPFADESIDRIIVAHELEHSDYASALLDEMWRVLKPEGRLLVIVPNRLGWWARFDNTPFGHGRAFSGSQLRRLLQNHRFVWQQRVHGLFFPPSQKHVWLSLAGLWEWLGARFAAHLGGLIIAESSKQVYHVTPIPKRPPGVRRVDVVTLGELAPTPAVP